MRWKFFFLFLFVCFFFFLFLFFFYRQPSIKGKASSGDEILTVKQQTRVIFTVDGFNRKNPSIENLVVSRKSGIFCTYHKPMKITFSVQLLLLLKTRILFRFFLIIISRVGVAKAGSYSSMFNQYIYPYLY